MGLAKAYVGLPLSTLQNLQMQLIATISGGILPIGQSYTIGERSFTLASLAEVNNTLAEVNYAIRLATGVGKSRVIASFNGRPWWRY